MLLTKEQITKINDKCYPQGVFVQPNYVPIKYNEPVIYMRWSPGGVSGGSCWDSSDPRRYDNDDKEPNFMALDEVLKIVAPNITYLQYKDLEKLIHSNSETEYEYYGNSEDWEVKYLVLSDLEKFLKEI